jgi:hypothetical protein
MTSPPPPPPKDNGEPNRQRTGPRAARNSTLAITNLTTAAGIFLAVNEALSSKPADHGILAIAALFVLGAQVAQDIILGAIDRFFGKER